MTQITIFSSADRLFSDDLKLCVAYNLRRVNRLFQNSLILDKKQNERVPNLMCA